MVQQYRDNPHRAGYSLHAEIILYIQLNSDYIYIEVDKACAQRMQDACICRYNVRIISGEVDDRAPPYTPSYRLIVSLCKSIDF